MARRIQYPRGPHSSGQARVQKDGKTIYLGQWGSPESYRRFAILIGSKPTTLAALATPTVAEVAGAFLAAIETGERKTSPKEREHFQRAVTVLLAKSSDMLADDFDANALEEVRDAMQEQGWGLRHTNRQTTRIKTMWRWIERNRLAPRGSWENLKTLAALGQGIIPDDKPPIPSADIQAVLRHLGRIPRAMVEVQLMTGARAAEMIQLRPEYFRKHGEMALGPNVRIKLGALWAAELPKHKNAWRGQRRLLLFSKRAQEVIAPFLHAPGYCFDPVQAQKEWVAAGGRSWEKHGECYSYFTYRRTIHRACKQAGIAAFSPHALRRTAASRITAEHGAEIARLILGQRTLTATRIYVHDAIQNAIDALGKTG